MKQTNLEPIYQNYLTITYYYNKPRKKILSPINNNKKKTIVQLSHCK